MNCDEVQGLLSLYADNMLKSDEANFVSLHLKACEACFEEYERLLVLISALQSMKEIELPKGFEVRLHDRLIKEQTNNETAVLEPKQKKLFMSSWFSLGAFAAVIVILFMGLYPTQLGVDGPHMESGRSGQSSYRRGEDLASSAANSILNDGNSDSQLNMTKTEATKTEAETEKVSEVSKEKQVKTGADTFAGVSGASQEVRDSTVNNGYRSENARREAAEDSGHEYLFETLNPFVGSSRGMPMAAQELSTASTVAVFPFMYISANSPDDFFPNLVSVIKSLGGEIKAAPQESVNKGTNIGSNIRSQVTYIVSIPCSALKPFVDNMSELGTIGRENLNASFDSEICYVSVVDDLQNRKNALTELLTHTSDVERISQIRQEISAIDMELAKVKSSSGLEPTFMEINIIVEENGM